MATLPSSLKVFLYGEPSSPNLDLRAVARYVAEFLPSPPDVRSEFFTLFSGGTDRGGLAFDLARLRIREPMGSPSTEEPLYGEVEFERRGLEEPSRVVPGVVYDGWGFVALLRRFLPRTEGSLDRLHIVLTPRLVATLDEDDRRYHARTILLGLPMVISTGGLVEAPAKPREFYLLKRSIALLGQGLPTEVLKEPFQGQFLDYGDERLTEVVKGYALQALAYHVLGEAFCPDPHCRLFNAHWQREMLQAQVESPGLCESHRRLLQRT